MRFSESARGSVLATGLLLATGCGGSQPTEPATPAGTETQPATEAPAEPGVEAKKFDDMAPAEKLKFMKEVVAPEMAKAFQAFDSEHYTDFGCVTCHGPGAKDGNFKMPTDSLPKLPEDMAPVMAAKPDMVKFMAETVKPQMAKLLGDSEFSCLNCHTKE